ncbi:Formylglycine-generating enzyme, required for sulfatase activity, contains SUMF1/FGE domain [Pedobacter steynii]|uniref:Formylglycine-generating enzyme, required for sulfatase activity, contains SUMF1/FGE domain n=1 Tax=Pedobacter steynii TaxID=430522 RepID=A0A1H0H6V7_9SPHI|nr:formylglycine-generating enzyme family protein [Pedobacter steynii]NQX42710.1 formylglycine-generating enzyme family protein [Pedobacter steynii]SDO14882.1 Formylglycine-generating enzyme, required for sulfatase activity, contains SUMF1/FGE domain [Pedobacter steynii]
MEIDKDLLVEIPAGEIVLRDDRIKKEWSVKIDPFLIARYPVTQDLYFSITKESPSFFKGDKKPVEQVTWKDAITFCNLLSRKSGLNECYLIGDDILFDVKANGYRLPLEAEWEYACKAGTQEARYGNLDEIAWYKGNSQGSTHEVGTKVPNAWGLYDMLGDVWEWCSDIYDEEVYGSYRIFRGGGWCDEARGCLTTNRRRSHPTSFKIDDLGFRLARSL